MQNLMKNDEIVTSDQSENQISLLLNTNSKFCISKDDKTSFLWPNNAYMKRKEKEKKRKQLTCQDICGENYIKREG